MANKKTNKFAAVDLTAKEVKEAAVQAAPAETVKTEEKAPDKNAGPEKTVKPEEKTTAVQKNAKETAEAKPEVKSPAKCVSPKAEPKPAAGEALVSEKLVIEFCGANYGSGEIVQKCKEAFAADHPEVKLAGIEVYINVIERRAYYVGNGKAEGKYIEL